MPARPMTSSEILLNHERTSTRAVRRTGRVMGQYEVPVVMSPIIPILVFASAYILNFFVGITVLKGEMIKGSTIERTT
jgi:hypothetical protein